MEKPSKEAQTLIDTVGSEGDVSEAIKDDPSLISGLTEYAQWRQEEGQRISCSEEQSPTAHPIKDIVKSIKPEGE